MENNPAAIAAFCLVIGGAVKSTGYAGKWIPLIVIASGAIAQCAFGGFTGENLVLGAVSGGSAIGLHQVIKQSDK